MPVYRKGDNDTIHLQRGCNGATDEVRLCGRCATELTQQTRIYRKMQNQDRKQFVDYQGETRKKEPPHVIIHGDEQLQFSRKALELADQRFQFVKPYISKDGTMVALKPVHNGNVDETVLSAKGGYMSFQGIESQLSVEINSRFKERFEVEWDADDKMYVVDFAGKQV